MRQSSLVTAVDGALRGLGTPSAGETIVAALSGGADSVALLDALVALGGRRGFHVVAAHLDHGLRPDSGRDAAFCVELCGRLAVPLRTAVGDVRGRAQRERGGVEEAGRRERYAFLRAVKDEAGAVAIAVAHTRDDQAETFLLRLLRGAGASGLAAMRPRSGDVLRPLLAVSRQQVLRHLEARGLSWRDDPSNADPSYLRNRVRHELLPYLEAQFNPEIHEALARTASLLADEAELIDQLGAGLGATRRDGDAILFSRKRLSGAPRAQARAAVRLALGEAGGLRGITAAHVERLLDLAAAEAPSGRRLPLPGGREALFRFDEIRVGRRTSPPSAFAYPLRVPGRVELPGGGAIVAGSARGPAASNEETAVVAVPEGPLVVRTRQPGDRVRRNGRDVSLRRFLMEQRVPADLRGGLPLVASGGRVLWVPGAAAESLPGDRLVRLRLERMR